MKFSYAPCSLWSASLALVVLLAPSLATAACQQADAKPSDETGDRIIADGLQKLVEQHKLPGMIGGILYKGKLIAVGSAGVRKNGDPSKMSIHDKIHLGSCTKAMTATLAARLVEQGKLKWDSTLADVFPEFAESMHADYQAVTLQQLLTHRGGLPANSMRMLFFSSKLSDTEKRRSLFETGLQKPPKYPPGSQYAYSNLGYMLAGLMAEQVTETPWQQLMQEQVFQPLAMSSAGFGAPGETGKVDQPWGHKNHPFFGFTALQADNPSMLGPAGTVHCSLADWAKFVALHLGHARDRIPLLTPETLQYLHQPPETHHYALGWGIAETEGFKGKAIAHAGSNTMWYAVVWAWPEENVAVLIATNSGQEEAPDACSEGMKFLIQEFKQRTDKQAPRLAPDK